MICALDDGDVVAGGAEVDAGAQTGHATAGNQNPHTSTPSDVRYELYLNNGSVSG